MRMLKTRIIKMKTTTTMMKTMLRTRMMKLWWCKKLTQITSGPLWEEEAEEEVVVGVLEQKEIMKRTWKKRKELDTRLFSRVPIWKRSEGAALVVGRWRDGKEWGDGLNQIN